MRTSGATPGQPRFGHPGDIASSLGRERIGFRNRLECHETQNRGTVGEFLQEERDGDITLGDDLAASGMFGDSRRRGDVFRVVRSTLDQLGEASPIKKVYDGLGHGYFPWILSRIVPDRG
jgi:hypothetical protein